MFKHTHIHPHPHTEMLTPKLTTRLCIHILYIYIHTLRNAYISYRYIRHYTHTHRAELLRPLFILSHQKTEISAFMALALKFIIPKNLVYRHQPVLTEQHVDERILVYRGEGSGIERRRSF